MIVLRFLSLREGLWPQKTPLKLSWPRFPHPPWNMVDSVESAWNNRGLRGISVDWIWNAWNDRSETLKYFPEPSEMIFSLKNAFLTQCKVKQIRNYTNHSEKFDDISCRGNWSTSMLSPKWTAELGASYTLVRLFFEENFVLRANQNIFND